MHIKLSNAKLLNYAITIFFLFFVLLTVRAQAQVVIDNRSAGGAFSNTGVTTFSWTHTVSGSDSNRALFVGVSTTSAAGIGTICMGIPGGCQSLPITSASIISVTYNGIPLDLVAGAVGLGREANIYRLTNPYPGINTITVMLTPGAVTHAVGNSVSFSGVNQITPNSNSISGGNSSNSPIVNVSGTGVTTSDMVFDALASEPNAGFFLEGPGQTVCIEATDETTCTRGRRFFFNAYDVGASSTEQGNPAGVTMSWTMTSAQPWVIAAVVVKAAPPPTAASAAVGGRVLTSTGRAVSKARVTLTFQNGERQSVLTNPFGYYRFDDIQVGQTAVLEVFSKRFRFAPQAITVNENLAHLDFTSEP